MAATEAVGFEVVAPEVMVEAAGPARTNPFADLGLARELRTGTALGSETAALVQDWKSRFDDEVVEEAIAQARVLLRDPAGLAAEIGKRLEGPDDLSGVEEAPSGGEPPLA